MIRISTNTLFEMGSSRIGEMQSSLARTTEQIATGRRLLSPSDDPVAAAQAMQLTQTQAMNAQFATNRQGARHSLSTEEQALQAVTSLIQDVQTMVVGAGNGALDTPQRQFMATELRGRLDDLMGLANTRDGSGNYLFSGFQTATQPYTQTQNGVAFSGDQGQRMLQVGPARQIAVSNAGASVFENIKNGNGNFAFEVPPENTGSGTITLGSSTDGRPLADRYEIEFVSETQYIVLDPNADPADIPVPQDYVSGRTIEVGNARFSISGAPRTGDKFAVEPPSNESVFSTLNGLISLLETPAIGEAGKAALSNGLNAAGLGLSNALDNVLTVRASVGARLKELDSLDAQGEDRNIQLAQTLAELQDLDYTQAITDLTKKKIILEAAQQSFVKTSSLSLFNYM